jgi:hypothetical protein
MMDEFKKQLAAISGQDIGDLTFYSQKEIEPFDKKYQETQAIRKKIEDEREKLFDSGLDDSRLDQKYRTASINAGIAIDNQMKFGNARFDYRGIVENKSYIKTLNKDIGDHEDQETTAIKYREKSNKPINIDFAEGDYPFYYKGKNGTLVGKIKGNQIIDVRTFTNENSKMTIQDFAKGKVGDAYRLEKDGKGIYNLSKDAREGYDFLNFQKPTWYQLESTEDGFRFGTSSLEEMNAALRDRSSIEALNYLGVELNAYKSKGAMLDGNGQVTFRGELVGATLTKPISGSALIQSMNTGSSSSLLSNQGISSSPTSTVKNLASNTLESNGSLTGKVSRLLRKIF